MNLASEIDIIESAREEEIQKGELIGDIRMAQLMKKLPVSDKEGLEKLSFEELQAMLKEID